MESSGGVVCSGTVNVVDGIVRCLVRSALLACWQPVEATATRVAVTTRTNGRDLPMIKSAAVTALPRSWAEAEAERWNGFGRELLHIGQEVTVEVVPPSCTPVAGPSDHTSSNWPSRTPCTSTLRPGLKSARCSWATLAADEHGHSLEVLGTAIRNPPPSGPGLSGYPL